MSHLLLAYPYEEALYQQRLSLYPRTLWQANTEASTSTRTQR